MRQFPLGWWEGSSVGSGSVARLLARCMPLVFRQCVVLTASVVQDQRGRRLPRL